MNQITEVPPAQAEVIEVRQYAVTCPECGQTEITQPPAGLEMTRSFGARLEGLVVYYRQEQHLSYERTQTALWNLHGVAISQGGIDQIMQRAGQRAVAATQPLQQAVRASTVVNSDETSARVDGRNWWEWVFCTATAVLHVIKPSRGADVIQAVMGTQCAEVWGSDCWSAQLKAPAQGWQLCLAHQLRNLQAVWIATRSCCGRKPCKPCSATRFTSTISGISCRPHSSRRKSHASRSCATGCGAPRDAAGGAPAPTALL